MKTLLLAAAVAALAAPASAQVAAGTVPNTMDAPAVAAAPAAPQPTEAADPRSEPALRAFIASAQADTIDYDAMTPGLAEQVRAQADRVKPVLTQLGALESARFIGKAEGADLFVVKFENALTQWVIGLDETGKVGALLFRPAPAEAQAAPDN